MNEAIQKKLRAMEDAKIEVGHCVSTHSII